MRRTVVTGIGCVTPIGAGRSKYFDALSCGTSGVRNISLFDASAFPVQIAAEVCDQNFFNEVFTSYPAAECIKDRKVILGLNAFEEALKDSNLDQSVISSYKTGLNFGLALEVFPIDEIGKNIQKARLDLKDFVEMINLHNITVQTPLDTTASLISKKYKTQGPAYINCSACAASTQAIGHSFQLIRRGELDVVLAGGFDSMINPLGIGGFSLLGALSQRNSSPSTASRPFDALRDGAVLGEGAGVLVIEELEHALNRRAKIYCEIAGFGSSLDAYKPTDPEPSGSGAIKAMRDAINMAEITSEQIKYINAHGTSTPKNDEVETIAIKKVFGQNAYNIPVSSVKSMIGHLIAASGAVESIACISAFERNLIPPTINYTKPDHFCDLDYVPNFARKWNGEYILKNSFGFGGQNASLVFKRWSLKDI